MFTPRTAHTTHTRSTRTIHPFVQRALIGISSATILSMSLGMALLPAAHAAETTSAPAGVASGPAGVASAPAGVVLVADTTPAPVAAPARTTPVTRVIGIDANVVNGLSITAPKGTNVTVSAKNATKAKSYTKKVNSKGAPVVFTQLVPGKKYAVTIDGKTVGTGTPVNAPGAAYNLTITSTGKLTSALVSWKYQDARGQGIIDYQVSASPVAGQMPTARSAEMKRSITSETTDVVIGDLDPDVLYTFTVTPHNTAANGKPSSATLPITLGAAAGQLSAAEKAQAVETARVSAQLAAEAAARAAANSRPAVTPAGPVTPTGPAAPTTKTIYVCPAGYVEAGALCEKTAPYTYTVIPYTTYTVQEWVHNGWSYSWGYCTDSGKSGNWSNGDPYCQQPTYGYEPKTYNNATPAGYTDTGSAWSKKDATPTGYTDNGSTWIAVAAKEAKVVPA